MGLRHTEAGRPLPLPNPTTQPFFDAAARGRLALQRCPRDGFFFYPRSRCPRCLGDDWEWESVSGEGKVYSFTIDRVGHTPGLQAEAPYVVAMVDLAEGPRMTARIRTGDPEAIAVGQPVRACFEEVDGTTLVAFAPVSAG